MKTVARSVKEQGLHQEQKNIKPLTKNYKNTSYPYMPMC